MSARALDPEQQAVVNASTDAPLKVIAGAGTGKTHTLTERFIRLVREEDFAAESILAITFTEKAAGEMASRIRGALARHGHPVERSLSIFTFHAFASELLRRHPEAAGIPPDFTILSDVPQSLVLRRVFADAAAGRLDVEGARLNDLAALDISDIESVRGLLRSVINHAKGRRWTPDDFEREATALDDLFYDALPSSDEAWDIGPGKEDGLSLVLHERLRLSGLPCRAFGNATEEKERKVRKIYYSDLRDSDLRKNTPRPNLDAAFREQRAKSAAMIAALAALFREYNRRLEERNALDYDDLILRAARLLDDSEEVRAAERERFRYILVDEFQDTSPAQMDLISALAAHGSCPPECQHRSEQCGEERPINVTIVGDRKQAIYGWRNARRENLDAFIRCDGEARKALSTNYRSATGILNLANAIGQCVESRDPALNPHRDAAGTVHAPPAFEEGKARQNRRDEAIYIAERIQAIVESVTPEEDAREPLHKGDPLRYSDVAVLIRKASQFNALRREFKRRNIPYICEGAVGLMSEPAARDTLAALRAIARPHDETALYRLLAQPPVSLPDADLVRLRVTSDSKGQRERRPLYRAVAEAEDGTAIAALRARLQEMRRVAKGQSLAALLPEIPRLAGFAEVWDDDSRAHWPALLNTLLKVAEEAEAAVPAASVEVFLDTLDVYDEDAGQLPSPATESEGVRVMTIHKAKGLEFPVVFVPSIRQKMRANTGWFWDDGWGLIPCFVASENAKRDAAMAFRQQTAEAEGEEDRCWYVAATRARDHLCVTAAKSGNAGAKFPLVLADCERDDPAPEGWNERVTVRRRATEAKTPGGAGQPVLRLPRTVSFSALSLFQACAVRCWIQRVWGVPEELGAPAEHGGFSGRRLGDLFHVAMARWYAGFRDGLPDILFRDEDTAAVRDAVRARWMRFEASECAVWTPISIERRIRYSHATAHGPLDISGYVDLILPGDGPARALADFKSNERLEDEAIDRYALQLALYRLSLNAAGQTVAPTAFLLHFGGGDYRRIPVDTAEREPELRALLDEYAAMIAGGTMPESRTDAPCATCWYANICPRSRLPAPETAR